MLLHLLGDLRYAVRRLGASPSFTAVTVLTIAIGVGINTGLFSVLNGIALRGLPAPAADELVTIHQIVEGDSERHVEGSASMFSTMEYRTYVDRTRTLSGVLGYSMQMQLGGALSDDAVSPRTATFVTCNYFDVLGQPLALGPGFGDQDCLAGAAPKIVLAHDAWMSEFGADPGIVGRNLVLNRQSFTVVGIAPEGVRGLDFTPVSYFAPIAAQPLVLPGFDWYGDERTSWLKLIGRRADDISIDEVRAEMSVIAAGLDRQRPPRQTALAIDRARKLSGPAERPIALAIGSIIMASFALVLLIACANVGNLLLAHATARSRELAVRFSLGASRARVVQSLLAESLVIAAVGGLLGSILAVASFDVLVAFVVSALPFDTLELMIDTSPDIRVLLFALALSLGSGIVCGLVPALRATRMDLHTAVKQGDLGASGPWSRSRLQGALVGVQVAACMVLMIAAGLLLRGLQATQSADVGFAYENVAVAAFGWGEGYNIERISALQRQVTERVAALPGIDGVAQVAVTPLETTSRAMQASLPGTDSAFVAGANTVSPGYFALVGIPIVRGRTFTDDELGAASTAVIVTESTARRLWPGRDPLGQTITTTQRDIRTGERLGDRTVEVVGVAADAQIAMFGNVPSTYLYFPAIPQAQSDLDLLVRTGLDFGAAAATIRAVVAEVDPVLEVRVEPLEANLDIWRRLSALVSAFASSLGMVALALAAVGIYGVVAYAVAMRLREIGIRLALGASTRDVFALILRRTMRPIFIGALTGIAAAAAVSRVLSSVLFGVSAFDPIGLGGSAVFVIAIAVAAGVLAARPATRADPMVTLRCE